MRPSGKMPMGSSTRWLNIANWQPAAVIIYFYISEKIINKKNAADAMFVFILKKTLMQP